MAQREILSYLEGHKERWCMFTDIIKATQLEKSNAVRALKDLRKYQEVEVMIIPEEQRKGNQLYMYKYKG